MASKTAWLASIVAAASAAALATVYISRARRPLQQPSSRTLLIPRVPLSQGSMHSSEAEAPSSSAKVAAPVISSRAQEAEPVFSGGAETAAPESAVWTIDRFDGSIAADAAAAADVLWSCGVTRFRPFYYCCDGFDDSGWGCGYRCIQALVWQVQEQAWLLEKTTPVGVPSLEAICKTLNEAELASALRGESPQEQPQVYALGEWLAVDAVTRYLGTCGLADCRMFSLSSAARLDELAESLREHFVTRDLFAIVEGTGQLFLVGGVRCVARNARPEVDFFVVDVHGPPQLLGTGPQAAEAFAFTGGVGWVSARALLFDSAREQLASAFPGQTFTESAILDHIGGWRVLMPSRADS
eukprot:Amastigsp_a509136_30.p1 type:complete len:355 gc:universal Amastigsp_a509136_30:68-1132(+)